MSVVSNVQKLYKQVIGGTAPGGAASSTGDISQMVKYLIATPGGGPTWAKIAIPPGAATPPTIPGLMAPGIIMAAAKGLFYAVGSPVSGSTGADTTPTYTWDSTAKLWVLGNTSTAITGTSVTLAASPAFTSPYGTATFKTGAANAAGLLIPGQFTQLIVELYGKWTAASAYSADRGIGLCSQAVAAASFGTQRNIGFYRKSAAGWTIESADGTTQSDASEASDTSDNAYHWFKLIWDGTAGNARLYVDGVLKVTKTTNLPAIDINNSITKLNAQAAAADATNLFQISSGLVYWQ